MNPAAVEPVDPNAPARVGAGRALVEDGADLDLDAALHDGDEPPTPDAAASPPGQRPKRTKPRIDRLEAFFSRLGAKSKFFNRLFSLVWLPYAFRSGIRMKRIDKETFTAVLPFKRFNRNWYNAMAGAALLANSEIAAGMYIFGMTGGGYSVVCKELTYKFLRPCFGPAVYRVNPKQDVAALLATGEEFNVELDLDILQQIHGKPGKERRVGRCTCQFHVTPKSLRQHGKDRTQR